MRYFYRNGSKLDGSQIEKSLWAIRSSYGFKIEALM